MGYYLAFAPCWLCKRVVAFNPDRVPSIHVNGEREPLCRSCVERVNPERMQRGLEPITIEPGAYDPADEGED